MVLLSLYEPRYQKKVQLIFLPITRTNPIEKSDSYLYDLELKRFRDPKAQGKDIFNTKHYHNSGDLDTATIQGHFSFYILVNQHLGKGAILLLKVIDHDY